MARRNAYHRTALEARQETLVQRLEDGDLRIADARARGVDTGEWESFWLHLLDEYVAVSVDLDGGTIELRDAA